MMNNKVKIISIITLLTLAIMLCVMVYSPSNETIKDKIQTSCNHVDSNIDMKCDKCHAILPYKNYLEAQKLNAISEDNTIAQISGNMPKNTNAQISNIDQAEAINIANKHINISNEDIVGAYNISLNTKTNAQTNNSTNTSEVKYQPEKLNQSVNVELSNVSIDLDKQYVMLHILDNNNYELIPIEKLSENKISFKAKSFSTYMLITVEGYQVTFTGENYKVYDGYGREITDGMTIASGTDFKFTIEANAGYGITTVTSSAGTLELKGYTKMKTAKIAAVNQNITIDVITVSEPKIVTGPESTKVKVGDTATFSVVAENATTYQWQYRDVGEEGFTNVETNGTSETLSVVVTEAMSGREYRCLIGNSEFTNNERIESDIASLFIAYEDITSKVVVKDLNEILPKITAQPVSQKIKVGETAEFIVGAENATIYSWQYKISNDSDDWKKVDETLGTSISIASGYDTDTLTIDTKGMMLNEETLKIANDISGYVFRCVITNEESLSQVATSDWAFLSVYQDDITLDNIIYADYKVESTEAYYLTLEKAIEAAVDGDKIIILRDILSETSTATIDKDITIDTNGHTITKETTPITVTATGTLTIIGNGTIQGGDSLDEATLGIASGTINNDGTLIVKDGTVKGNKYGIYSDNESSTLIIGDTDNTLSTQSPVISGGEYGIYVAGEFKFDDGTIKGTNETPYHGTAIIENLYIVEISGPQDGLYSASLTINIDKALVTEWTIPVDADGVGKGTTIKLPIPAHANNNYVVDWGDGSNLEKFDSTANFPTHTYKNTSETKYTIKVAGAVNQFGYTETATVEANDSLNNGGDDLNGVTGINADYYTFTKYVTGLISWGEVGATRYGFANCTNLTGTIPMPEENSFKNVTSMENLFYMCSNLNGELLENLFMTALKVESFANTFYGCSGLTGTIPTNLFIRNNLVTNISNVFNGCEKLTGMIPAALFNGKPLVTTYAGMFEGCIGLTAGEIAIDKIEAVNMDRMFKDCTGLESVVFGKYNKHLNGAAMFEGASSLRAVIMLKQALNVGDLGSAVSIETLGLRDGAMIYVPYRTNEAIYEQAWSNIPAERIEEIVKANEPNPDYVELNGTYVDETGYTVAGFGMNETSKYTQYGFRVEIEGIPVNTSEPGSEWIIYTLYKN